MFPLGVRPTSEIIRNVQLNQLSPTTYYKTFPNYLSRAHSRLRLSGHHLNVKLLLLQHHSLWAENLHKMVPGTVCMSRQVSAVPDLCCIVTRSYGHAISPFGAQQSLSVTCRMESTLSAWVWTSEALPHRLQWPLQAETSLANQTPED